jgi:hypothetical protein
MILEEAENAFMDTSFRVSLPFGLIKQQHGTSTARRACEKHGQHVVGDQNCGLLFVHR